MMNDKIYSLQIIRAFAAVIVAICHIWNDGWLPGSVVDFGGFGVDLFFVLSGFIMCLTVKINEGTVWRNAKDFLYKRIVRIFPIYLICALPLILFVTHAEGVKSFYYYIGNIFLLPSFNNDLNYSLALPPGWTLVYEMFFYYIFAAFLLLFTSKDKVIVSILLFLVAMFCIVNSFGLQGPRLGWVNLSFIIGHSQILNFGLGILSYLIYLKLKDKVRIKLIHNLIILISLSFFLILLIFFKVPKEYFSISFAFVIVLLFTLNERRQPISTLLKKVIYIGDASYSIYLTHFYIAFFKLKLLAFLGGYFTYGSILINLTDISLMIFAVVGGCVFYHFIERRIIHYFSK